MIATGYRLIRNISVDVIDGMGVDSSRISIFVRILFGNDIRIEIPVLKINPIADINSPQDAGPWSCF